MVLAAFKDLWPRTPSAWGHSPHPLKDSVRNNLRISLHGDNLILSCLVVAEAVTQDLIEGSVSGLMGLAFQALAETQAVPFWQSLINSNQLSSPEMAFQLARSTSAQDEPGGTFTLGGTNSSLFTGNIEFNDLTGSSTPQFWQLSLSGVFS